MRLRSRRSTAAMHATAGAVAIGYCLLTLTFDGVLRVGVTGIALGLVAFWLALVWATLPARRRLDAAVLERAADGAATVHGSLPLALLLGAAWLLGAGGSAVALVAWWQDPAGTDLGDGPRGGLLLPITLGLGWTVVSLVRLLLGRVHPWRLTVGTEGVHYRGWRTDRLVAWDRLRSVALTTDAPHLVVRPKGTKEKPVKVPLVCFDLPGRDLLALVEEGRRAHAGPRFRGPGGRAT